MGEPLGKIIFLYILFFVIVSVLFWLIRKVLKNNIIKLLYIFVLVCPLVVCIPVEFNTLLYGDEFKNVEINTGFNNQVIYYKVFSINDTEAKLFYVEGDNGKHEVGNFYYFVKENGKWKYDNWDVVWSSSGSASGFTIPPYF